MQITQRPDTLCFAGNIPDIEISGLTDSITVTLKESGGEPILDEIYTPDAGGNVSIHIREIITSRLSTTIPPSGEMLYVQENISKTFILTVGSETITFTALAGGVYDLRGSVTDFLTNNLLTWQTAGLRVKSDSVIFASYYSQEECRFRVNAVVEKFGARTETVALGYDKCYTINLSPAFWAERFSYKVKSLDVFVETLSGYALTASISYVVTDDERIEEYMYINSVGGIDTLVCSGNLTRKYNTGATLAKVNARLVETTPDLTVVYKQNTGYLTAAGAEMVQDFFLSSFRYHIVNGKPRRIVIEEQENDYTAFDLNSYEFEYRHEELSRYINLVKPSTAIPLPPYWGDCRAYFDKKKGNKIIDRKSGLEITIEGNKLYCPDLSGYDVFNKTNRNYWSADIPATAGQPRVWNLNEITGLFTMDYATDYCTRVLFFRDVKSSVESALPIIVYSGLNAAEIEEVVKYLKEYYFLEDGTDRKLLTQEGQANTFVIEEVK